MPKKFWTPEKVIEELRRTRRNGPRANRKLDDAARRCFGSVRAALKVAGLPCGKPLSRNVGWSKATVVEAIRKRHRRGKSLLLTNREDRALYEAAKKRHGSWTAALAAAGFPRPPRDFYTRDEVQLRIIDLYERGLPLTFRSHKDIKLRRSGIKHFGGWRKAVESLGLGSELPRLWTDQKVIEAILLRRAEGFDLSATSHEDPGLFAAGRVRFGSWNKALVASGISAVLREQWNEEKVLTRIRQLLPEVPQWRIRRVDPKLTCAAEHRFGSLRRAIKIARAQAQARKSRSAR
jgi:hypothetical protein